MTYYPFYQLLQNESQHMENGNFGLWYNKFIPLSNSFKASDNRGGDTRATDFYRDRYVQMKKSEITALLKRKHDVLANYCDSFRFLSDEYEIIQIEAILASPLITGIGESHPHEISLVFDHNLGIPYIPASGVKGIVRFAHTLSLLPEAEKKGWIDEKGRFNDEADWTFITNMFGAQTKRGQVVFLDAYSKEVPKLHIDIMNPHYGPYYSDGLPPADHHNPTPIKFLTVAPGTTFIFRAIAKKENDLPQKVQTAIVKALTEEGVGAKTAVGYGRFEIDEKIPPKEEAPKLDTLAPPPVEETWNSAHVNYSPGGGGILTAQSADKRKAQIHGKDKAINATDQSLHKKIFEGKRTLPKAYVTVRKIGNAWEIVRIEPEE